MNFYARHILLDAEGNPISSTPQAIELAIWEDHPEKPGYVRKVRNKTYKEVFAELYAKLEPIDVCDGCGAERVRPKKEKYGGPHKDCPDKGDWGWLLDEYFSGPNDSECKQPIPDYRWIACYGVTGTSEGHYIHVEFVMDGGERKRLALGKSFKGMNHAFDIARRCALILGA